MEIQRNPYQKPIIIKLLKRKKKQLLKPAREKWDFYLFQQFENYSVNDNEFLIKTMEDIRMRHDTSSLLLLFEYH